MYLGLAEIYGDWRVCVDRATYDLRGALASAGSATAVGAATNAWFSTNVAVAATAVSSDATDFSGAATAVAGYATSVGVETMFATATAVGTAGFLHILRCADSLRLRMVFIFP